MAVHIDSQQPFPRGPVAAPTATAQAPRRDQRTSRDALVQVARQTLVRMRADQRNAYTRGSPRV